MKNTTKHADYNPSRWSSPCGRWLARRRLDGGIDLVFLPTGQVFACRTFGQARRMAS